MGGEFKGMQGKFKGNIEHVAQASNYATTASVITHKYIKCKSRVAKCQIFFTRSKPSKPSFTPTKMRKSEQFYSTWKGKKATSGEQKLNILSYNSGLKTEFHII